MPRPGSQIAETLSGSALLKTLVTGATGFIGRQLVPRLLETDRTLRAIVRPETEASELERAGVEVVRGDIRDLETVRRAIAGCHTVHHLAARTSHGNLPEEAMRAINVEGTANMARAAAEAGVERFVHCSTARVYGIIRDHSVDEDTPFRPDSPYPETKAIAESIVRDYHASAGLPAVIARITAVFGPGSRSWLGLFQGIADGRFRILGSGANYHHPAYVTDIVEGLLLCADRGKAGRAYILTGEEAVTLREMTAIIARNVGAQHPIGTLPLAPLATYKRFNELYRLLGGDRLPRFDRVEFFLNDRIFDTSRARIELGFVPKVGIEESIRRTAEWYRRQGFLAA